MSSSFPQGYSMSAFLLIKKHHRLYSSRLLLIEHCVKAFPNRFGLYATRYMFVSLIKIILVEGTRHADIAGDAHIFHLFPQ
jgi:hypothetical protein